MSWQFSWKLGLIGLLLVFTYIPYLFIYLFIYLFLYYYFFSLTYLAFVFNFYFTYLPFPLPCPINFIIFYVSILLSHYAPNLLLPRSQYHYFLNIVVFILYKLIVFLIAI